MRVVEFRRYLDDNNAIRVRFEVEHGRVTKFTVQLECRFGGNGEWTAVVRYDTAHGFAHCDRFYPDDQTTKTQMVTQDYNQALTFALDDLTKDWAAYRRRYEQ
jgi:hypothetical protein